MREAGIVPNWNSYNAAISAADKLARGHVSEFLLEDMRSVGVAADVFKPLADSGINVDMIIQNASQASECTDLTFTVPTTDLPAATRLTQALSDTMGAGGVETDSKIAKVSIVGVGMRSHSGVALKMFEVLRDHGVNIQMISTSEIKISVVIQERFAELAVRALHDAFGLERQGSA